jgi:hypothetical protein
MKIFKNNTVPRPAKAGFSSQPRAMHRERDFGVGYGSSSGYAAANDRRYAQSWAKTLFRCS